MTHTLPTGFYPFWFWNDRLSADEIRRQVAEMARQGVRGFFIHPRQGLGQPYLSEAFFEMVDVAIAAAEEHGLIVHLYDEYPYPSGVAGGRVTLGRPEYHATELIQRACDVPGGPVRLELPAGKVLSVMAYPLVTKTASARPETGQRAQNAGDVPGVSEKRPAYDSGASPDWSTGIDLLDHVGPLLVVDSYRETGLTRYNQKRYFASRPTPVLEATLPHGPHRIFVSVQTEVTRHKYWGHFADVLNPDAVAEFIRQTYERYRARYGDKFGRSIRSIFVDETQPGWSARLPDAFRAEYGYDLLPLLPALQDATHPDHLRVACDLHRLQYKLFCASWEEPISRWCRAHGLAYSGEKPSLRLAQLRYMDIPGCEPGHTKAGAALDLFGPHLRQNAKATASAAYFYGKEGALDECYHSLGWSGTLQDAKLMADGQLLAGITCLVPHGFFYSTHALRKHDAPPTFFFQAPYWPLFGKLAAHVDRVGRLFAGTHIDAQILVVEPTSGLPARPDLEAYVRLQTLLLENHLDFHFADTDILQSGRIEPARSSLRDEIASGQTPPLAMLAMTAGESAGACLHVADLAVKLIIVPPMRVIEPELAAWLAAFEAAGGHVIRCDRNFTAAELLARLRERVEPSLSIRADGAEAAAVYTVKRVGTGRTLWFVLNTGARPLTVVLASGCPLREIPLDPDRPIRLQRLADVSSWRDTGGRREVGPRYSRSIRPFESFLLEACAAAEEAGESSEPASVTIFLRGPARVCPLNPNLLRLTEWRLSLLEAGAATQTAVVPAVPLGDQLERGGFRFTPVVRRYFGHEPELDWPTLHVRYEATFENRYTGAVEFVMEPGSIIGDWRLWVNEHGPLTAADLRPSAAHVRGSLGADITAMLRPGPNTLRVEITDARPEGGLLNPLYLAGDFGVTLTPLGLCERSEAGGFETYEANGLPFYAGVIEYGLNFDLARSETDQSKPESDHVRVDFVTDAAFHEACEVSLNGGPWRTLAWEPRSLMLPVTELRPGHNEVRVRVYTTLIRAFEGQWFDYDAHCYREVGRQDRSNGSRDRISMNRG